MFLLASINISQGGSNCQKPWTQWPSGSLLSIHYGKTLLFTCHNYGFLLLYHWLIFIHGFASPDLHVRISKLHMWDTVHGSISDGFGTICHINMKEQHLPGIILWAIHFKVTLEFCDNALCEFWISVNCGSQLMGRRCLSQPHTPNFWIFTNPPSTIPNYLLFCLPCFFFAMW